MYLMRLNVLNGHVDFMVFVSISLLPTQMQFLVEYQL